VSNIITRVKAAQGLKFPPNQEVTMNADGSGGPISINTGKKYNPVSPNKDWKDWAHIALDVAGMIPAVGNIADGINAAWYAAEGDYEMAGLSAAAAIPGAGLFAGGGKLLSKVNRGMKTVDKARKVAKHTDPSAIKIASKLYSEGGKKVAMALPEVAMDNLRNVPKNIKRNLKEGSKFNIFGNRPVKFTNADRAIEIGDFAYGVNKGVDEFKIAKNKGMDGDEPIQPGTYNKQRYMGGVASSNRQNLNSYKR
jgi:hypothetical protein